MAWMEVSDLPWLRLGGKKDKTYLRQVVHGPRDRSRLDILPSCVGVFVFDPFVVGDVVQGLLATLNLCRLFTC